MPESARTRARFVLRRWTASLRVVPGFVIIGAQKSGTTTLYQYLVQHPAVGRAFVQEVHFFDLNYQAGLSWYRAHFPTVLEREWVRRRHGTELMAGEASAYYLFHPGVPARVKATLPRARFLVVLRDPVDRAWAHYLQSRGRFDPLSFEEAIEQEEARLAGERDRLLADEHATSLAFREYSYLSRGVYVDQLRTWMAVFPRDQIHIERSEDLLFGDPVPVVLRVQEFLGLPPRPPSRIRIYRREDLPEMPAATRRRLEEHFRPHNRRLFDYLGTDFGWSA